MLYKRRELSYIGQYQIHIQPVPGIQHEDDGHPGVDEPLHADGDGEGPALQLLRNTYQEQGKDGEVRDR